MERVRPALEAAGLTFGAITLHPDHDLDILAGEHGVSDPAEKALWKQAFQRLNGDHTSRRMALLPFSYHRGIPIPEELMKVALAKDDAYVEEALGIHNWEERIIILHETYVTDPAPEVGHYRVTIHEVGHAVDHALERALGPSHRETVERFYREDLECPERFLTDRAGHNVREYFAEAVEAFFTLPTGDTHDGYKTNCNRVELKKRRPELYEYLERVL